MVLMYTYTINNHCIFLVSIKNVFEFLNKPMYLVYLYTCISNLYFIHRLFWRVSPEIWAEKNVDWYTQKGVGNPREPLINHYYNHSVIPLRPGF